MNHLVFSTGGDWDSTTLYNDNQEVPAAQLYVDLQTGRDEFGNPDRGGIANGGDMTAFVRPQENPDDQIPIFPGRLDLSFPGHKIEVENDHPTFAIEFTRVWYNGNDVTNHLIDLFVNVNAIDNQVKAYLTLYKPHWLSADEVATINIL